MRNLNLDDRNQGIFFPKIRTLFSNFEKRAGETSPLPSSYAPALSYLIEPVVSMAFWEDIKFFPLSYLLLKTLAVCLAKEFSCWRGKRVTL